MEVEGSVCQRCRSDELTVAKEQRPFAQRLVLAGIDAIVSGFTGGSGLGLEETKRKVLVCASCGRRIERPKV